MLIYYKNNLWNKFNRIFTAEFSIIYFTNDFQSKFTNKTQTVHANFKILLGCVFSGNIERTYITVLIFKSYLV